MVKIVINATGVSPDVLVWLKRANHGHYYIERRPNREHATSQFFEVPKPVAEDWAQDGEIRGGCPHLNFWVMRMSRDIKALKAHFRAISYDEIRRQKAFYALPEEVQEAAFQAVANASHSRRVHLKDMVDYIERH